MFFQVSNCRQALAVSRSCSNNPVMQSKTDAIMELSRRKQPMVSWPLSTTARIVLIFVLFQHLSVTVSSVRIVRHSITKTIDGSGNSSVSAAAANIQPIAAITMPGTVEDSSSVLLDCDYIYDAGDVKLVVRWFFNDSTEAIYQWIPASDNRYVAESISKYFDFDFRVSEDRFTRYRALRLRTNAGSTLPATLTGKYSCVISSIMSQDSRSGQLVIYFPPKRFEFNLHASDGKTSLGPSNHITVLAKGPLIRCTATDVFPQPVLTFSELSTGNTVAVPPPTYLSNSFIAHPSVEVITTLNHTTGLYTSGFEYRLPPDTVRVGTVYECKLELSTAGYVRKKRIKLIYPSTYHYPESGSQPPSWWRPGGIAGSAIHSPTVFGAKLDFRAQSSGSAVAIFFAKLTISNFVFFFSIQCLSIHIFVADLFI